MLKYYSAACFSLLKLTLADCVGGEDGVVAASYLKSETV